MDFINEKKKEQAMFTVLILIPLITGDKGASFGVSQS